MKRMRARILAVMFIVATFVTSPLAALTMNEFLMRPGEGAQLGGRKCQVMFAAH